MGRLGLFIDVDVSMASSTALAIAAVTIALLAALVPFKRQKKGRPSPPGPRGLPFIGNTHQIDSSKPQKTFTKWKYQYGDLVYCRVLGIDTFVVNSEKIARDLLEKRSHNYSDKTMAPQIEMLNLHHNTAWASYSDTWRMHRRIYHQALRADVVVKYIPTQLRAAYKLLENLLLDFRGADGWRKRVGASDTTFTTLQAFLYFMVQYPEAQHRAQEAIDAVVGRDRFPNFEDRPALPIIDALIRETLRRAPALPVDLPHGVTDDDIYEGYFISKGSNIMVNTWAILHDEVRFVNPMKFDPDRFLDANGQLTNDHSHLLVFGFGRRMCPGRHLADASLWSAMACMLAMFDFARAKDAQGREINIDDAEWSNGLTSRPTNFKCSIRPRFPGASEKIRRALEELDLSE